MSRETEIVGYPVLPLLHQLVEQTPPDMGKYLHWGATTQDIQDDAATLQMKEGLRIVGRELGLLVDILTKLAEKYRDT
jgi:adenylosuccinate lyase